MTEIDCAIFGAVQFASIEIWLQAGLRASGKASLVSRENVIKILMQLGWPV